MSSEGDEDDDLNNEYTDEESGRTAQTKVCFGLRVGPVHVVTRGEFTEIFVVASLFATLLNEDVTDSRGRQRTSEL